MSESTAQPVAAAAVATNEVDSADAGHKVFAGNLAFSTDEAALKEFFSAFNDDITAIQIIFHGPRSAGYGFVTFKTEEAATKAAETLNNTELNGRHVIVERARPVDHNKERRPRGPRRFQPRKFRKPRRGNSEVPKTEDEAPTAPAAAEPAASGEEAAAPKPRKKRIFKKKAKKPAAEGATAEGVNGTTEAEAPAEGEEATAATDKPKRPRKPRAPRRPRGEAPTGEPSKSVLFVANLSYTVDEAGLTDFFAANGITINSARVVRWRWGTPRKSKGYAFVDVGNEEEQKKAIEAVQGKSIADREITVKVAVNGERKDEAEDKVAEDQVEGPVVTA